MGVHQTGDRGYRIISSRDKVDSLVRIAGLNVACKGFPCVSSSAVFNFSSAGGPDEATLADSSTKEGCLDGG